jgi:glycosyltransferase involved in cell wall biosynthesis
VTRSQERRPLEDRRSPRLTVVIPARNAEDHLPAQLRSLAGQDWSELWEVLVVDDGSSDGTAGVALSEGRALGLRLRVIPNVGSGAAAARNSGAAASAAPWLAFVDADDEVAEGWLAGLVAALAEHSCVAGHLDRSAINDPHTISVNASTGAEVYSRLDRPYMATANLAVWRQCHDVIGGFDVTFRGLEDVDYCWRLQEQGFALHFSSAAVVRYRLRRRLSHRCRKAWREGRAETLLLKRHGIPPGRAFALSYQVLWLLFALPRRFTLGRMRGSDTRGRAAVEYAWRLGRLFGCIQYRYGRLI